MVGDIAAGLFGFIVRGIVYIFTEMILEILVYGSGNLILRIIFRVKDPSNAQCAWTGGIFLVILLVGVYFLYRLL